MKNCPKCRHRFQNEPFKRMCDECRKLIESEKRRITNKRYQEKHKEELKIKKTIYVNAHRDEIYESTKKWLQEHPGYLKNWRAQNKIKKPITNIFTGLQNAPKTVAK